MATSFVLRLIARALRLDCAVPIMPGWVLDPDGRACPVDPRWTSPEVLA